MEAEENINEEQYLNAFNNGYLIAKHEPELAKKLAANSNDQNNYFKAFVEGQKQYDAEVLEWAISFRKGRNVSQNIDLTKDANSKKK